LRSFQSKVLPVKRIVWTCKQSSTSASITVQTKKTTFSLISVVALDHLCSTKHTFVYAVFHVSDNCGIQFWHKHRDNIHHSTFLLRALGKFVCRRLRVVTRQVRFENDSELTLNNSLLRLMNKWWTCSLLK